MFKKVFNLLFIALFFSISSYVLPQNTHCSIKTALFNSPRENRSEEYLKWLKVSIRIKNKNVSGSGTICYYDKEKNTAYVITCGHLFNGGEKTTELNIFYKNDVKLTNYAKYTATLLALNKSEDLAILSFTPDWEIDSFFPIAPIDYEIIKGKTYYSLGCDGAREVACYLMKAVGMEGKNLVLTENAPRHGRSGGGLLTDDNWFIGVCWGSTDPYNGTGQGLFVPLQRIHPFIKVNKLDFLLDFNEARKIPIVDGKTGEKLETPHNYIPIP